MASSTQVEKQLILSASKWMGEALTAWTESDYAKVATLAPLAVEHLGKAVLWHANPVLLVPLKPDAEFSLFKLATDPDLASPELRTIGLLSVFIRLKKLVPEFPLEDNRRKRLVEVRNGAMHVGASTDSRHVLLDCLTINKSLLLQLDLEADSFYGEHTRNVQGLLEEKRSEVGHHVAAKRARSRQRLTALEERFGESLFLETTNRLEREAKERLDAKDFGAGFHGIEAQCPECGCQARLFGTVDPEAQPDWDVEPLGNGQYEPVAAGYYWEFMFSPEVLACVVCELVLSGKDELREGGIATSRHEISSDELGETFDPNELDEQYWADV